MVASMCIVRGLMASTINTTATVVDKPAHNVSRNVVKTTNVDFANLLEIDFPVQNEHRSWGLMVDVMNTQFIPMNSNTSHLKDWSILKTTPLHLLCSIRITQPKGQMTFSFNNRPTQSDY